MSSVAIPPLTVEDYKILPETGPRYQLIEGALYMAAAPNRYHQHISRNLEFLIFRWIKDGNAPGAQVYNCPFDVYLDEHNVFQPDLVYVSPENASVLTDAGCEGPPDLVVEILSPRTRKIDLGPKKKVFARSGVRELWIIDPEPRQITIYDLASSPDAPVVVHGETDSFSSILMPGLVIDAAEVFEI
ncbi:Uma2 family endonuclease [soil metagenome]